MKIFYRLYLTIGILTIGSVSIFAQNKTVINDKNAEP